MKRDPRLLIITHRSPHHARHSGTPPLAEHLPGVTVTAGDKNPMPYRAQRWLVARLHAAQVGYAGYDTSSLTKEISVLSRMIERPRRDGQAGLAHFLHGEHDFWLTGRWARRLGWQTVATFHHPPSKLHGELPDKRILRRLDGLIGIGSSLVPYLREQVGHERVYAMPYGINTDFFTPTPMPDPAARPAYAPRPIFVGQHLRDFDMLGRVLNGLHAKLGATLPGFGAQAVLRPLYYDYLPAVPFLERCSIETDEGLRDAYRGAAMLLIPFVDVTACTSIMEAMACGVPIVTNEVGSVRDYVDESCAFICPNGDADAMIEAAARLLTDPDLNQRMRQAARERALRFAWPKVAAQHLDLYRRAFGFVPASEGV
jgi:glycosyltransferase involved in cell wall biosynthesis